LTGDNIAIRQPDVKGIGAYYMNEIHQQLRNRTIVLAWPLNFL
jgi:hypothetical protein